MLQKVFATHHPDPTQSSISRDSCSPFASKAMSNINRFILFWVIHSSSPPPPKKLYQRWKIISISRTLVGSYIFFPSVLVACVIIETYPCSGKWWTECYSWKLVLTLGKVKQFPRALVLFIYKMRVITSNFKRWLWAFDEKLCIYIEGERERQHERENLSYTHTSRYSIKGLWEKVQWVPWWQAVSHLLCLW